MRQVPKKLQKRVRILRNPDPKFVSVVDHAATQLPFAAVKSVNGEAATLTNGGSDMGIKRRIDIKKAGETGVAETTSTVTTAKKSTTVRKLTFDANTFKDESAVKTYLANDGWDQANITITKDNNTFVVARNGVSDDDFENIRVVKMEDGVTGYIGTQKSSQENVEVEPSGEDEDDPGVEIDKASSKPYGNVKYADPGYQSDGKARYPLDSEDHIRAAWNYINKTKNANKYTASQVTKIKARIVAAWKKEIDPAGPPEAAAKSLDTQDFETSLVKKFDYYNSYYSGGTELADVIQAGMGDGLPPGFYDIMGVAATCIGNILRNDDDVPTKQLRLKNVGDDLATLLGDLYEVFSEFISVDEEADDVGKSASAKAFVEDVKKFLVDTEKGNIIMVASTTETKKDTDAEAKKDATEGAKPATADAKPEGGDTANKTVDAVQPDALQTFATSLTEGIMSAVKDTMENMSKAVNERLDVFAKKLDDGDKAIKEAVNTAKASAQEVTKALNRAPTKKGVDLDGDGEAAEEATKAAAEAAARETERKADARRRFGI